MKIHAHILCYNESDIIRFVIQHYKKFCSHITIYDNFSTDDSREIAESMGCEVRMFGVQGELNDKEYLKIKNHCWKGSDADYVIVCDMDEILYHPNLILYLEACNSRGDTIFETQGFEIFSDILPVNDLLELQNGRVDNNYSKMVIFNPEQVVEINYVYGCHEAKPKGNLMWSEFKPTLLHYRSIGGIERQIRKHKAYAERMSAINKKWGLGNHYLVDEQTKRKEWADSCKNLVELSQAGIW